MMDVLLTTRERRSTQRRKRRAGLTFPLTDGMGCIVPFDRSRCQDRRLVPALPWRRLPNSEPQSVLSGRLRLTERPGAASLPGVLDDTRDFRIAGELIASVSNIYNSRAPGIWKELELHLAPNGRFVCVEIWRTVRDDGQNRYWLTTCDDLAGARGFFGSNTLAAELFAEAATVLVD